jgi:hypothetical protein
VPCDLEPVVERAGNCYPVVEVASGLEGLELTFEEPRERGGKPLEDEVLIF